MARFRMPLAVSTGLVMVALAIVPQLGSAERAYTWSLNCNGDGFAYAAWNWTQGGQLIPGAGGTAACGGGGNLTGFGERPTGADGFRASLEIYVCGFYYCAFDGASATKSFDPAGAFDKGLSVSVEFKEMPDCGYYPVIFYIDSPYCKTQHFGGNAHLAVVS